MGGSLGRGHSSRTMDLALVIDLECWYHSEYLEPYLPARLDDHMPQSVLPMLDLLDRYDTRATFAVLGAVAERYPQLLRLIFDRGHEIASHGCSHKMLSQLSKKEFEDEILRSIDLVTSITGERPVGFRAPSFSMERSTSWALQVLEEQGFEYDASIFPIRSGLYGVPGAPICPYRPSIDDVTKEDPEGNIVEFPMTVLRAGVNIPIAGGFYLRVLPYWFLRLALRTVIRRRPGIVYLHPWETYAQTPRLEGLPRLSRLVAYHGLAGTAYKFERLLGDFTFKPVREVLSDIGLMANRKSTAQERRDAAIACGDVQG